MLHSVCSFSAVTNGVQVDECFDLISEAFSAFDDADDIGMNLEPCGSLSAGQLASLLGNAASCCAAPGTALQPLTHHSCIAVMASVCMSE